MNIFVGDINCLIGTVLYRELLNFCNDNQFCIIDVVRLPANSFTCDMDGSQRWLDHVICSNSLIHTIKNIEILNNYFISDHKALQITINFNLIPSISPFFNENLDIISWIRYLY